MSFFDKLKNLGGGGGGGGGCSDDDEDKNAFDRMKDAAMQKAVEHTIEQKLEKVKESDSPVGGAVKMAEKLGFDVGDCLAVADRSGLGVDDVLDFAEQKGIKKTDMVKMVCQGNDNNDVGNFISKLF